MTGAAGLALSFPACTLKKELLIVNRRTICCRSGSYSSFALPLKSPLKLSSTNFYSCRNFRDITYAQTRAAEVGQKVRRCGAVRAEAGADSKKDEKTPFGYTRKDVLLIGLGITVGGVGLKYGLEFLGLDSLQSGNVVQLVLVLGLMLAWTATYVFRVGNKEMTYVKQLKDYEDAVMKKRLEELPEAELETMLAEIEEEKERIRAKRDRKNSS